MCSPPPLVFGAQKKAGWDRVKVMLSCFACFPSKQHSCFSGPTFLQTKKMMNERLAPVQENEMNRKKKRKEENQRAWRKNFFVAKTFLMKQMQEKMDFKTPREVGGGDHIRARRTDTLQRLLLSPSSSSSSSSRVPTTQGFDSVEVAGSNQNSCAKWSQDARRCLEGRCRYSNSLEGNRHEKNDSKSLHS